MSCKLYLPEDARPSGPVVWPEVGPDKQPQTPVHASADPDRARLEQIEQQFEQRARDARAAGMREGEEAGRKRAAAEIQPVIARLAQSIEQLAHLRAGLRREAESDMLRLAVAIARRVLRRQLAIDPEALHGLVLAAFEKLEAQEVSRVRVHPSHAAALSAILKQSPAIPSVEVLSDPACEVGGVVFETARGNLDASVETQLQEIERGLADRLRRAP